MIIKSDQSEIQDYLKDASNTKGFCESVFFPENKNDIISVLKHANDKKISVTVCGNRTGLAGASVPKGGIVISTEKLNRILEINPGEKYAIVEPGVLLADFLNEIKTYGLYYPPDPTEPNCFIGGTIATNASGAKTFKYGSTRNFILSLEIALPTGEMVSINCGENFAEKNVLNLKTESNQIYKLKIPDLKSDLTKNAAGYFCRKDMDAIDLFIGSEGTLGIFTKIKLKLLNSPEKILSCVIFFNSEEDGLNFIEEAREKSYLTRENKDNSSIDALALEFFDKNSLHLLIESYPNIPEEAESAVWFEQELTTESSERLTELWMSLIENHNGNINKSWIALDEKEKSEFENFRHAISAKVNEFISSHNYRKLGTDFAVPDKHLKNFYSQIKKEVRSAGLDYVIYGHLGNSHIHLNMLPKNDDEFESAIKIYSKICTDAIKIGGTFSAEHGVGKNKTDLLLEMYGENVVREMFVIKKTFDPHLILCPGNIFNQDWIKNQSA